MLTSRHRAQLRALANTENAIIQIGKGGITENIAAQTSAALTARELVKCRVLESAMLTAREACDELAGRCGAEGVQVIGSNFVLFRQNEKEPKIVLVKDKR